MACSTQDLKEKLREIRVAARADLEVSRHVIANTPCYVLRDPITFDTHRLSTTDYAILASLTDDLTLHEVFQDLEQRKLVNEESEEEFYKFVLNLQRLGLLTLPVTNGKQLYERYEAREQQKRKNILNSILFFKVPLLNPDRILEKTMPYFRFLYTKAGWVFWCFLMMIGGVILFARWSDFTDPLNSVLAVNNLPFLWACLFVLKVFHEFGHAYACKNYGGKVTEMGAFFMCFNPCAFVDASAAWGFPHTKHRVIVSLGGMHFESMVAVFCLVVWNFTEPSFINSCAYYAVLMASMVTILFNINPLMKYDGYYVLCDVVGIPNLKQKSSAYAVDVAKKYILGIPTDLPDISLRRSLLLFGYGVGSGLYKTMIVLGISMMIASKFMIPGLLLAAFYITSSIGTTLYKMCKFLWFAPEVGKQRMRAILASVFVLVVVPLCVAYIPIPGGIHSRGYVSHENKHVVRPESAGILAEVLVEPGTAVDDDQDILRTVNVDLDAKTLADEAELRKAVQAFRMEQVDDPQQAFQTLERIAHLRRVVGKSEDAKNSLLIPAGMSGTIVECPSPRSQGNFVQAGDPLAIIVSGRKTVVALVDAVSYADSIPEIGKTVRCQIRAFPGKTILGTIKSVAPAGSQEITNEALTQIGGGDIAVDASTGMAVQNYFEVQILLNEDEIPTGVLHGMTADVMFTKEYQSLLTLMDRKVRLFFQDLMLQG